MKWIFLIIFLLLLIAPIWLMLSGQVHLGQDFETADRSSAEIALNPTTNKEAVVQVYSARAFNWRGLFSSHTWFAIKPQSANHYQVLQVIGWNLFRKLPVLEIRNDVPDRIWFGNKPKIIAELRGETAATSIPKILAAAKEFPFQSQYRLWPGPNSNTFIAYVARRVPELNLALPSTAIGKDFLVDSYFFAKAPSGTGYQFSLYGLLGVLIAKKEGLEINILGLVFGINPLGPFIDWPFIGKIGW